jgi:hypothetical protein
MQEDEGLKLAHFGTFDVESDSEARQEKHYNPTTNVPQSSS